MRFRTSLVSGLLITPLLLAACGAAASAASATTASSSTASSTSSLSTTSTSPSASTTATSSSGATAATVDVRTIPNLGKVLTDSAGRTLYHFKKDGPDVSNCTATCATIWPPFSASAPLTLPAGVPGKLGLITRKSGKKQVTYNGMPLYTYSGDTKAGEAKGQGLLGSWFAVKPGSTAATASSATVSSSSTATTSTATSSTPAKATGGY
ncbi:MAG: hypothetical protein M1118_01865 [Chloroflexi bacterium]|nr:hypothetical protein [Chloroflexota bacterium]